MQSTHQQREDIAQTNQQQPKQPQSHASVAAAAAAVAKARPVATARSDQPLTTSQIQAKLDENAAWIRAIVDNLALQRHDLAARYQEKLQASLMLLASIADAQQPPAEAARGPQPQQPASTSAAQPVTRPTPLR